MKLGRDAATTWRDVRDAQARYLGLRCAKAVAELLATASQNGWDADPASELAEALALQVNKRLTTVPGKSHEWEPEEVEALCDSAARALRPGLSVDDLYALLTLDAGNFSDEINDSALALVLAELVAYADTTLIDMGL